MLIEKLIIKETLPKEKIIREIKFNLTGLNLVVDNNKRGNGLGKTTFLRLIDIGFGTTDVSALYIDKEQNLTNKKLEEYIEDHRVTIELYLIDENQSATKLEVGLYKKGERKINGKIYSVTTYNEELNKLIFGNNSKKPTFRQLIGKFVRVKMDGDNDKFLKFGAPYTKDAEYDNIYNFLFNFSDIKISEKILSLKKRVKELEKKFKTIKASFDFENRKQIETELSILVDQSKELLLKQKTYVDKGVVLNEKKIIDNRTYYSMLNMDIEQITFDIEIIENNLKNAQKQNQKVDKEVLKDFYDEVSNSFEKLSKSFEELVSFNEKLVENKILTNKKLLVIKKKELEEKEKQKEIFFQNNRDFMFLIEQGDINEYFEIQSKINEIENLKGKAEKALELYSEYETEIVTCNNEILQLKKHDSLEGVTEKIDGFNKIFMDFSQKTLKSQYYIFPNDKGFPISIANYKVGPFSTGSKKTAIIAFDLSYFVYAKRQNIKAPWFIVHDVLENIDMIDLADTLKLIKETKCQYIAAMLREKVKNQPIVKPSDIILELSEDNKLFKI
ncbi:MAG: hypothetical protein PHG18_02350 [Bacilli bacterium]|nr:hypothetical protein [Bacilli bacterium]